MAHFWTWFGRVDNVLGLIIVFLSGYTALTLRRQKKRIQQLAKNAPKIENFQTRVKLLNGVQSINPIAFALSLSPDSNSIKPYVQVYLRSKELKMYIVEVTRNGLNGAEDLESFVNELTQKRREFEAAAYTEVHLFINGPVMAGVLVGAAFDNWLPVKLYHKPRTPPPEIYEYWMPLV